MSHRFARTKQSELRIKTIKKLMRSTVSYPISMLIA